VPIVAFAIIPAIPTASEWLTAYYDDDSANDFELTGYPYIDVYTDFD
jgi:hypothetical protein